MRFCFATAVLAPLLASGLNSYYISKTRRPELLPQNRLKLQYHPADVSNALDLNLLMKREASTEEPETTQQRNDQSEFQDEDDEEFEETAQFLIQDISQAAYRLSGKLKRVLNKNILPRKIVVHEDKEHGGGKSYVDKIKTEIGDCDDDDDDTYDLCDEADVFDDGKPAGGKSGLTDNLSNFKKNVKDMFSIYRSDEDGHNLYVLNGTYIDNMATKH